MQRSSAWPEVATGHAKRTSAADAVAAILNPGRVAIIGASSDPTALSGRPLALLRQRHYDGEIHLVNHRGGTVAGQQVLTSADQLPDGVDLALVLVPATATPGVLQQCASRGVRAAYVFSSGFAESSDESGLLLQEQIRSIVAGSDLRVGGPNGEGCYNVVRDLPLTFSPTVDLERGLSDRPRSGNVALVAQSGGVGFGLFHRGVARGIGFSHVVTTGNEVDLELLDYVDALVDDETTRVIGMFVEGFARPEELEPVLRRARENGVAVVVAKVGRSEVGSAAAASHTGHLASRPELVSSLLRSLGAHEAADADEMLDLCAALSAWGGASGTRVAVYTLSGGIGAWIADTCVDAGASLPELDAPVRRELSELLPPYASTRNPVDLSASFGGPAVAADVLERVLGSESVDSAVIALSMIDGESFEKRWTALREVIAEGGKPVLLFTYTEPGPATKALLAADGQPWYTSQRGLAASLLAMATERYPVRPRESSSSPDHLGLPAGRTEADAKSWLAAMGIPVPEGYAASDADHAARVAEQLGGPLALKGQHPELGHKTEAGLVELGVDAADATDAYRRIVDRANANGVDALESVLVERMAAPGVEMMVGLVRDAGLGTFVLVGRGGTTAELDPDVVIRPAPVTADEALDMVSSLRGAAVLDGWRAGGASDRPALAALVATVSSIGAVLGAQLDELDLNPVLVHAAGSGVTVVDALLVTGNASTREGAACNSN